MATSNLYLVTQALTQLLSLNVRALLVRNGLPATLNVSSMPPERVGAESNTLNLYLYHTMEAGHYRNVPPPGTGQPPVAREPLALSLYYILTAHHQVNDVFDAETQQLLFGLAMKTLHDFSTIGDDLAISPGVGPAEPVMPADLAGRDNRFDIALRPLTAEEALTFWHADDSATTRLSAYYEVRPVLIEPEPASGVSGLVFDVGLFLSAGLAPHIEATSALVAFEPPAQTGLPAQAFAASPARVTLAAGLPVGPVNRVNLSGRRLDGGGGSEVAARIVLRCAHWLSLAPPLRAVRLDAALNPDWAVQIGPNKAQFDAQGTLLVDQGGGPPVAIDLVPGIYSVSIQLERFRDTPSGSPASVLSESNRAVVSIGPRILASDPPDGAGRITVHLANLFDVTDAALDVQLAVDGVIYAEVAAFSGNAAQDAGRFRRAAADAIEFQPAFAVVPGETHAIRLVVNAAESQPFWAVMP